jgi:hypothetical protein
MLGCTFNEYKDRFEENLAKYLEAYEDNTPLSFLKDQIESYKLFLNELNKISNELRKYGETNANKKFLRNRFFNGLIKLNIKTYEDIQIENKSLDSRESWNSILWLFDPQKKDEDHPDWFEARINYIKLKKHIVSAEKILKFIEGKYQIFEQEEQQIITLALGQQDAQSNIKLIISAGVEPIELETIDQFDPNKSKKEIIEKYLKEFTDYLSTEDYLLLTDSLLKYFLNGKFPKLDRKITFKKINIKKVGWALKEVYQSFKTEKLNITFLGFAVENINLFSKYKIPKDNLFRSNIYKAFTTNPKSYNYN